MSAELVTPGIIRMLRALAWKRGGSFGTSDELFSVAECAVATKLHKFIPGGIGFSTWAWNVANFAITDHLRTLDLGGRGMRKRLKEDPDATHYLTATGRKRKIQRVTVTTDECLAYIPIWEKRDDGPDLEALIFKLDPIENFIVYQMFFFDGTLLQLANFLGFTESRASQIRSGALLKLRRLYQAAL